MRFRTNHSACLCGTRAKFKRIFVLCFTLLIIIDLIPPRETFATVAENTARHDYTGNGSSTTFAYTFRIVDKTNLTVFVAGAPQTVDVHYTVTGVNAANGGSVVFNSAPANGAAIAIMRNQPLRQDSTYGQGNFPSARVERDYDKLWMALQQLNEGQRRGLRFPPASANRDFFLPMPSGSKCLAWNAASTAIENVTCGGGSSVSGVLQAVFDAHVNATTAHGATSLNTANRIVQRDGSGNFAAGSITGTLLGNASTATLAAAATALAADGTDCPLGQAPRGVDAQGNAIGCAVIGAGNAPGGASGQVQFNNSGAFGGDSGMVFDPVANILGVGGDVQVAGSSVCRADGTNCPAASLDNQTAAEVPFTPAGNIAATNVQTALQELDTEKQPLDSDLTALAGNSTNGLWAHTGAGTGSARTITGTSEQATVTNGDGVSGNPTISIPSTLTLPGLLQFSNVSPAQITANQNNYAGCAGAVNCRISTDVSRTITGFSAPTGFRIFYITNIGVSDLVLANESASSTAQNRLTILGAADFTVPPSGVATFVYDVTAARWRMVTVPAPVATLANTLAKYIPPEVTVASLPASPEPNRMVTVTNGLSPGSCETGGGTNRTDCRWNSVSNHWEPPVPVGSGSQSYQQVLNVGRVNTNSVDLTTAVRDGNDTVQMARYVDSSNVYHEQLVDASGAALPFDRIYRIDAGKVLDVQNHLGVSLFQVDEATGAILIGGSAGLAGECLKSQGAGSPPQWTTC